MLLMTTPLLATALMFGARPPLAPLCTPVPRPLMVGPLGGPPACLFGGGHFAGSGKAPLGYEEFACFPTTFYFRPGTPELTELSLGGELTMGDWFKYNHGHEQWVVLTLAGRSEAGESLDRSLLDRRARAILDWLSRQGRRRDRVEVRTAPQEKSALLDTGSSGPTAKAQFGAYVTGLIAPDEAEKIRQSIRANPKIIYC